MPPLRRGRAHRQRAGLQLGDVPELSWLRAPDGHLVRIPRRHEDQALALSGPGRGPRRTEATGDPGGRPACARSEREHRPRHRCEGAATRRDRESREHARALHEDLPQEDPEAGPARGIGSRLRDLGRIDALLQLVPGALEPRLERFPAFLAGGLDLVALPARLLVFLLRPHLLELLLVLDAALRGCLLRLRLPLLQLRAPLGKLGVHLRDVSVLHLLETHGATPPSCSPAATEPSPLQAFRRGLLLQEDCMSGLRIVGIALIILGVVGLIYGQFSYTRKTHDADLGVVKLSIKERETVPVPTWACVAGIAAGAGLLLVGRKR